MNFVRRFLDLVSRVLTAATLASVLLLIARWVLSVQHPSKLDAFLPFVALRRWLDPVLVAIGNWSGLTWSPDHRGWLPLVLVLVVGLAYTLVMNGLEALIDSDWLSPPAPRAGPVLGPAAAAAPGAPITAPVQTLTTQFMPRGEASASVPGVPVSPARSGVPAQIGRYEVVQKLGQGAMGIVYKARDTQIGRTVAIKSILASDTSDPAITEYKQRFLQEAQSAGQLNHPGIVTVHDLIEDAHGQPCLVMEFIEGNTLDRLGAGAQLPVDRILELMIQVATALAHAHAHGIVHRDVKPANIMVTQNGHAKVSDFGIAKMSGSNLTMTGQLIGTPGFMSPEGFTGGAVDARSDIFSLGGVLYWLCTGERPFSGDTVPALAYSVVNTAPKSPRETNPAIPEALERIVLRCLAKDPNSRYPDAQMLAADLTAVRAGVAGEMTVSGASKAA
jgi:tRNA A-37 threonylcarbamoyl transferase component Bud32